MADSIGSESIDRCRVTIWRGINIECQDVGSMGAPDRTGSLNALWNKFRGQGLSIDQSPAIGFSNKYHSYAP
jgi:hypothetical protein